MNLYLCVYARIKNKSTLPNTKKNCFQIMWKMLMLLKGNMKTEKGENYCDAIYFVLLSHSLQPSVYCRFIACVFSTSRFVLFFLSNVRVSFTFHIKQIIMASTRLSEFVLMFFMLSR